MSECHINTAAMMAVFEKILGYRWAARDRVWSSVVSVQEAMLSINPGDPKALRLKGIEKARTKWKKANSVLACEMRSLSPMQRKTAENYLAKTRKNLEEFYRRAHGKSSIDNPTIWFPDEDQRSGSAYEAFEEARGAFRQRPNDMELI